MKLRFPHIPAQLGFALFLAAPVFAQVIDNGDFEQGNRGFRTTYSYSPATGLAEGIYTVATTTTGWHSLLANCGDHTTGFGKMMIMNGSLLGATDLVWAQTVPVAPDTTYTFSYWAASEYASNPADLRLYVDGVEMVRGLQLPTTTCSWRRYVVEWWSGSATSASFVLTSVTTDLLGNDFALDDITLEPAPGMRYCAPAVPNSVGLSGVCLFGGSTAAADGEVRLTATLLPPDVLGIFLVSQTQDFVQAPAGAVGNLCLGGAIGRLSGQVNSTGATGTTSIDLDTSSLPPPLPAAILPGDTWNFQFWHRDVGTSNFTSAVSLLFH